MKTLLSPTTQLNRQRPAPTAPPTRPQAGAALITAIFLIVVVALMASVVVLTSVTQQTGSVRALQTTQAWYAAVSRIEQATPGILASGSCPGGGTTTLFGFSTTLNCAAFTVSEGEDTYNVFSLSATASRGSQNQATLVRRTVRGQISNGD